jgi:hypothetical protein
MCRYFLHYIVISIIVFLCSFSAQAFGVVLSPEQQILNSEMIAIVDIKSVEIIDQIKVKGFRPTRCWKV